MPVQMPYAFSPADAPSPWSISTLGLHPDAAIERPVHAAIERPVPHGLGDVLGLDLLQAFQVGDGPRNTQDLVVTRADNPNSSMAALRMLMASGLSVQNLRTWRGVIRPLTVGPWEWARVGQCSFDRGCGFRNGLGRQRPFVPVRTGMGYDGEHHLLDVAADAVARDERSSIRERGGPCPSRPKTKTRAPSGSSSTTATPSFASVASPTWSVGKRSRLSWSCPPSSLTDCSSLGAPGAITLSRSSSRSRPTPSSARPSRHYATCCWSTSCAARSPTSSCWYSAPRGSSASPTTPGTPARTQRRSWEAGGVWSSCGRYPLSRCWRRRTRE